MSEQKRITIFVCIPKCCTKQITVNNKDLISVLRKTFGSGVSFLRNGGLLDFSATFEKCGVLSNDVLIALNKTLNPEGMVKWSDMTEDRYECLTNAVRLMMNKSTRQTSLRRLDMAMNRCEVKPKSYRKMVQRYESSNTGVGESLGVACVVPDQPDMPSDEPLPIWW